MNNYNIALCNSHYLQSIDVVEPTPAKEQIIGILGVLVIWRPIEKNTSWHTFLKNRSQVLL